MQTVAGKKLAGIDVLTRMKVEACSRSEVAKAPDLSTECRDAFDDLIARRGIEKNFYEGAAYLAPPSTLADQRVLLSLTDLGTAITLETNRRADAVLLRFPLPQKSAKPETVDGGK